MISADELSGLVLRSKLPRGARRPVRLAVDDPKERKLTRAERQPAQKARFRARHRAKLLAYARDYRRRFPEKARSTRAAWKAANPDKVRMMDRNAKRRRYQANPEKYRERSRQNRARAHSAREAQ